MQRHFDAVVAGGSIAGSCAASALADLGWSVLLCEPGLANHRRLAGELMQAPAVAAFAQLGLLDAIWKAGAVPTCGFAICGDGDPVVLSYGEIQAGEASGIAIEHSALASALLAHVQARPRVERVRGRVARVAGIETNACEVDVVSDNGRETVSTRLVVAADGSRSRLREAAGIRCDMGDSVRMLGCKLSDMRLPCEGYGHVFVGGRNPVLAYRVSPTEVRLMFESDPALRASLHPAGEDLDALPTEMAIAVQDAAARGEMRSAVVSSCVPARSALGRLALCGDAGGAVHPITATGVAFSANDAVQLQRALIETHSDVEKALALYDRRRRRPLRTRAALAPLLARALRGDSAPARALRSGLFSYWRRDRGGRAASLSLISAQDGRASLLVREYAKVVGHAMRAHPRQIFALAEDSMLMAWRALPGQA